MHQKWIKEVEQALLRSIQADESWRERAKQLAGVAPTAGMRKLLIMLNALVRDGCAWQCNPSRLATQDSC